MPQQILMKQENHIAQLTSKKTGRDSAVQYFIVRVQTPWVLTGMGDRTLIY